MSAPRTYHTVESLKARCVMRGDCWLWQGYIVNNTPQVMAFPDGQKKMVSVRKLLRELISQQPQPSGNYGHTCGDPACVAPLHTVWRGKISQLKHMANVRVILPEERIRMRDRRIAGGHAKLTAEQVHVIRASSESGPVLGARYGVSKALINRIKRNEIWREYSL
jgi:hypothetical protein